MTKFRNTLMTLALILIAISLYYMDFNNLSWSNNSGNYLGIISMVFVIISMIASNKFEKRKKDLINK